MPPMVPQQNWLQGLAQQLAARRDAAQQGGGMPGGFQMPQGAPGGGIPAGWMQGNVGGGNPMAGAINANQGNPLAALLANRGGGMPWGGQGAPAQGAPVAAPAGGQQPAFSPGWTSQLANLFGQRGAMQGNGAAGNAMGFNAAQNNAGMGQAQNAAAYQQAAAQHALGQQQNANGFAAAQNASAMNAAQNARAHDLAMNTAPAGGARPAGAMPTMGGFRPDAHTQGFAYKKPEEDDEGKAY